MNPARFEDVVVEMRRLRELVGNLEVDDGPLGAEVVVDGVVRTLLPIEVDADTETDTDTYSDSDTYSDTEIS